MSGVLDKALFFPSLVYRQLFFTLPKPSRSFAGETVIVTGSNTGLGFEAARHLARLDAALVIIAVRLTAKGENARSEILKSLPNTKSKIEVWPLDLGSYKSVQEFGKRAQGLARLDAVIENAGIATDKLVEMEDNESTVTVNVVSTFLLALLLLPKLRETATKHNVTPRLSIVASDVHVLPSFPQRNDTRGIFPALNDPKTANMDERYPVSKLLEVLSVPELAREMSASEKSAGKAHVILTAVNPGLCHSELVRNATGASRIMINLLKAALARTTEVGARTLVAGVTAGEEAHGKYMSECAVTATGGHAKGPDAPALRSKVWKELGEKLERVQPGILRNI